MSSLEHISNPVVTADQLLKLRSGEDDSGPSVRYAQAILIAAAGVLLRLQQDIIANAVVLLQRFWVASNAGPRDAYPAHTYSAASVYLAAKLSATPVSARSVINVYAYLMSTSSPLKFVNPDGGLQDPSPSEYFVSEGTYEMERQQLFVCENMILSGISFDTHVALPHALALTYLQALGASSETLAARVVAHLNAALLSPQLLYLTHQPNALAVAAIYLGAREVGVKLVEQNWWEVFDVDREDLGFLVLSLGSQANHALAELEKWKAGQLPFS